MTTKIVNLDNLKTTFRITLDHKEYDQKRMTVKQFINGDIQRKVEKLQKAEAMSPAEQVNEMVDIITAHSKIPRQILLDQDMSTIQRIILIIQGIDPTEEEASDTGKK